MERKKVVVLTGAGISAESGIATFRDGGGLWEGHRVEEVATPEAWQMNPGLVLSFYNERRRGVAKAEPNAAHLGLVKLESTHEVHIVTQNIDDLHERAGSSRVLHLHGEIFKMRSERDSFRTWPIQGDMEPGMRAEDGGLLRPHIVWFGEPVPLIGKAAELASAADVFVVVGTSLLVYPAAGLLDFVRDDAEVFVIDRKIPASLPQRHIVTIESTASEGVARLLEKLGSR